MPGFSQPGCDVVTAPLPDEFDLFAAWTSFPDGSTTTELYRTNDPV